MKSINGINWQINSIPERLILKNQQNFNISYLLSKVFLDNKYTDEEIHNSIYKTPIQEINYQNHDFENAANLVTDCLINKKKFLFLVIMMSMDILLLIYCMIILSLTN